MKTILLLLVLVPAALAFPDLNSIWSLWSNKKVEKTSKAEESKSRQKRQNQNIGDSSQLPYVVTSEQLPRFPNDSINHRYMPTLGNGHIGATVYFPWLYLNGLYNGVGAKSHRAAIPAVVMTRIEFEPEVEKLTRRRYSFDVRAGVFTEFIDCPFAEIEHRTYVHQKYIRLLVTDISAKRKETSPGGVIDLHFTTFDTSTDIIYEKPKAYQYNDWQVKGRTRESEEGSNVQTVHVFYQARSESLPLRNQVFELNETMIMAVDLFEGSAKNDFDSAAQILSRRGGGSYALLKEHMDAWKETWDRGNIELTGDLQLAKVAQFAQYYILSSLPPLFAAQPPQVNQVYHTFTRTGISKGGDGRDYNGHMFWDTEMYILPAMVLTHPDLVKYMLRYRSAFAQEAKELAEAMGHEGYRFPWESGSSGQDVTPEGCTACRDQSHHISGAVAYAIRMYFSVTRDRDYLTNPDYNGCDMTREIARFYASLAKYNSSIGRYDINGVMGPDDWHPNVNNNAFTNVIASLSIHWARYMACMCGRSERTEVPDEWIQKALYLDLPFDNVKRTHYQHQNYEINNNRTNKQGDAILLGWPLNWNMSRDIWRNDLERYEIPETDDRSPAMTWSFFTIGWHFVGEMSKVDNYFEKSYRDYMIQPFKVWTEYNERDLNDQEESSVNYLPGMGGFLQSLLYGFAGIRVRPEMLEFHHPTTPPNTYNMKITGLDYLGAVLDIDIGEMEVIIDVVRMGEYGLILFRNESITWTPNGPIHRGVEEELTIGARIVISNPEKGFYIYTNEGTPCEHPRDYIFMPWGYSPWISGSNRLHQSIAQIIISTVAVLLCFTAVNLR